MAPLKLKAYFKPTPSIGQEQRSVNTSQENISFAITGRHDPVIVPGQWWWLQRWLPHTRRLSFDRGNLPSCQLEAVV